MPLHRARGESLVTEVPFARAALLIVLAAVTSSLPARAWSERAHERVNAAAIENLPEPLRSHFRARKPFLVESASSPDHLAQDDAPERPHHFTEVEAYDSYPFSVFHKQFVKERRRPSSLQLEHGDCLWQIELCTLRLAEALRRRAWEEADQAAVSAAHYACDLPQPLHTVVNYDGQLTHQAGIHRRFETDSVNALLDQWVWTPQPAVLETDLRERIFQEMLASYAARNLVFAADHIAVSGRTYLNPQYFPTFVKVAGGVAKRRLEAAVFFVSSLWYTAWVRAGKPALGARPAQARERGRDGFSPSHRDGGVKPPPGASRP